MHICSFPQDNRIWKSKGEKEEVKSESEEGKVGGKKAREREKKVKITE